MGVWFMDELRGDNMNSSLTRTEQRFIHMIEYLKGNKHLKSNIEI